MFIDLLRKRRSIRQFQAKPIEAEKVRLILEAMLRAPSSRSLNPWEFVVVDDRKKMEELARAKPHGASFLKNAALAIVVCGDPEKCDVWIEDCSIASLLIHLIAEDLGLASCWVQIRLRENATGTSASEYVTEALKLDPRLEVEAIIAIGYPAEEKSGHSSSSLLWERVSHNTYGEQFELE